MAKYKGGFGSSGADAMGENISNFAELLQANEQKSIGGLSGAVASTFSLGAKISEAILKAEYKRIKKNADAEEKEQLRQAIIADARAKALKTLDKESQEKLKKAQVELKQAQKDADTQDKKNKQAVELAKKELDVAKQNLDNAKKAGVDTTKLEAEFKKAQQKHTNAQRKQDEDAKLNKVSLAVRQREIAEINNLAYTQALQELERKGMAEGITLADLYGDDGVMDVDDAKHQEAVARLESQLEFKSSSRGGLGLDRLDQDSSDYGSLTSRPKPSQAKAQEQTALSSTQAKAQANKQENIRAEEIAHRDNREKLLDNYHDLSLDELASISGDVLAIRKAMDDIHERIKDGELGVSGDSQDSGGGIGDFLSNMLMAKGAGNLAKKGLSLAKGIGTKVALPLAIASSIFTGAKSGMDTDAIAQFTGKDPSEVGILDRIQYGGAGLLSGLTGGIVGVDTIANAGEHISDFLLGGNSVEIREARKREKQANAELNARLAEQGLLATTSGDPIKDNSIHTQILENMGVEVPTATQGQQLAELNEGMGGVLNNSSSSVVNNNTTNVIPESPRFRINDQATLALASQGV